MNEPALRVLHLNSMLTGGGTDDQCVKLAAGLHQLEQQAWIAGPEGREFSKTIRELGVPYHVTPPEGLMKLRFIKSAAALVRRERIQIVHGHHGRDLWPTVLAAKLSGVRPKIIVTRHLAKSPGSWISRRFLLNRCNALVAVSNFVATVLREGVYEPDSPEPERRVRPPMSGDHSRVRVIYGGFETDKFFPKDATELRKTWGLSPGQFAFGMVGGYNLPRGKGQREFLQAAAKIHLGSPNARFLIIGRGNMADILRADIEQLGLAGKAWLTPYCNDMPAAMNALDCLVHSQVGTEAFPGVVLEAYASGRPVIASALDGIPEAFAVANLGQLVKPESVPDLAEAMKTWAARPALSADERSALHDKVAAGFSVRAFAERMLDFYRQLMQRTPG